MAADSRKRHGKIPAIGTIRERLENYVKMAECVVRTLRTLVPRAAY